MPLTNQKCGIHCANTIRWDCIPGEAEVSRYPGLVLYVACLPKKPEPNTQSCSADSVPVTAVGVLQVLWFDCTAPVCSGPCGCIVEDGIELGIDRL